MTFLLPFPSFDDTVRLVQQLGPCALMVKVDIRHAFHLCPVRPQDYELLGTCWGKLFYVELRLPFGLRFSVFIFNNFADGIQCILTHNHLISSLIHYLDDYFTAVKANSLQCAANVEIICKMFKQLGIPVAEDKLEGPTTIIVYLGIVIGSIKQQIRLPLDKYNELSSLLEQWQKCKKCTKQQLLSLIGKLVFVSKVVRSSWLFLCKLTDLSTTITFP